MLGTCCRDCSPRAVVTMGTWLIELFSCGRSLDYLGKLPVGLVYRWLRDQMARAVLLLLVRKMTAMLMMTMMMASLLKFGGMKVNLRFPKCKCQSRGLEWTFSAFLCAILFACCDVD